jgi:hypothetical protein
MGLAFDSGDKVSFPMTAISWTEKSVVVLFYATNTTTNRFISTGIVDIACPHTDNTLKVWVSNTTLTLPFANVKQNAWNWLGFSWKVNDRADIWLKNEDGFYSSSTTSNISTTPSATEFWFNDYYNLTGYGCNQPIGAYLLFNKQISLQDFQNTYFSNGKCIPEEGLIGNWIMMEGTEGSTASGTGSIIDQSGTRLYRKPILHSGLGSDAQLTTPYIGTALTKVGTPTYESVKFGNGIVGNSSNYAKFSVNSGRGTIEFYCKMAINYNTLVNTNFTTTTGNGGINFYQSNQGYIGCWIYSDSGNSQPASGYSFNYENLWSTDDILHIALTFDNSLGANEKIKVYINGVIQPFRAILAGFDQVWTPSYIEHTICNSATPIGSMDNIKVYDYVKTDFSDRFDEFGYWQAKTQNNGTPVASPVYKAAPIKIKNPRRGN